ncbi:hypothetical protein D3C81_1127360 [compost metagenome]
MTPAPTALIFATCPTRPRYVPCHPAGHCKRTWHDTSRAMWPQAWSSIRAVMARVPASGWPAWSITCCGCSICPSVTGTSSPRSAHACSTNWPGATMSGRGMTTRAQAAGVRSKAGTSTESAAKRSGPFRRRALSGRYPDGTATLRRGHWVSTTASIAPRWSTCRRRFSTLVPSMFRQRSMTVGTH